MVVEILEDITITIIVAEEEAEEEEAEVEVAEGEEEGIATMTIITMVAKHSQIILMTITMVGAMVMHFI